MRNVNLEENELTITAILQQHTKEETIQTLKEPFIIGCSGNMPNLT